MPSPKKKTNNTQTQISEKVASGFVPTTTQPLNQQIDQLLNERSTHFKAVGLLSNSLTTFAENDNASRRQIVKEIEVIEDELTIINFRLDTFFSTKILPPPPEEILPKTTNLQDKAACLMRRNAIHRALSEKRKKLAQSPENEALAAKIQSLESELIQINKSIKEL